MKYLSHPTLQVFLISLFSKESITHFVYFEPLDKSEIPYVIYEIAYYKLADCFYFTHLDSPLIKTEIKSTGELCKVYDEVRGKYLFHSGGEYREVAKGTEFDEIVKMQTGSINEFLEESKKYLFLKLCFHQEKREKLIKFLEDYILSFKSGRLSNKNFSFDKNFDLTLDLLEKYFKHYKNYTFFLKKEPELDEFRYYDSILYFILNGYLTLKDCYFKGQEKEFEMEISLKYTPEEIRQKEKPYDIVYKDLGFDSSSEKVEYKKKEDDDAVLELTYDNMTRQIFINKLLLKIPRYDSKNKIVFEYLYQHPNEEILKETLDSEVKKEFEEGLGKKPLHKIAQELGFTKELKKLFFITTKNAALLRIKITKKQLESSGIDISKVLPDK